MKQIRFRKLFKIVTERDYGYAVDAICYFENYSLQYTTRILSDIEAKAKGYRIEAVVVQYHRSIFIDLWFFTLYFQW